MAITTYKENEIKFYEVYVNGFDPRGKRIQKRRRGITSLRRAEQIEFELKHELLKIKQGRSKFTWSTWFDECVKRMRLELRASTVASYEAQLRKWVHPHWSELGLEQITKSDVYDLIFTECKEMRSDFTRRNVLKMIKRIFQMAVEDGLLDRNPCTGVNVKVSEVESKVLTSQEVESFLSEAQSANHRFYPVWAMALMTGMRSGELFALKWTDLDFENGTISVSKSWNSKYGISPTKSRRSRIVPMSDDLVLFLKEYRLSSSDEFILPRLGEWAHGEQAKVTREFCQAIGITSVKFHDLRATFITNLLARGESLARVMAIVGHTELKTTNGYLRKAGIELKGGTDKLGYRLPRKTPAKILSLIGSKTT